MVEILDRSRSLSAQDVEAELDQIAARYGAAGGYSMMLLNALGGQAEDLLRQMPQRWQGTVNRATGQALHLAARGAARSRWLVPDQPSHVNRWVSASMGAIGGAAGLPGALVELPATTTFLLRSIQGVAVEHGFNPAAQSTRFDALQVFAAAGPMAHDDGVDTSFLTLRLSLSGAGMSRMIAMIAPRLGVALAPKLAAQMVPVVGALAGASVNYVYSGYYQEMAHVHFALRRLALEADQDYTAMVERFQNRLLPTSHTVR